MELHNDFTIGLQTLSSRALSILSFSRLILLSKCLRWSSWVSLFLCLLLSLWPLTRSPAGVTCSSSEESSSAELELVEDARLVGMSLTLRVNPWSRDRYPLCKRRWRWKMEAKLDQLRKTEKTLLNALCSNLSFHPPS